jgi:Zn-dependent peptidase ImmA (M78 family)
MTNDQLWFSFFHEIGHILLHSKKASFIDSPEDGSGSEEIEREADLFASETLIKPEQLSRFLVDHPRPSTEDIQRFAARINLHDGVVAGRLQTMGIVAPEFAEALKVTYKWRGRD